MNKYFSRLKLRGTAQCSYCEEVDGIYHSFMGCSGTEKFWNDVDIWLQGNSLSTPLLGTPSEIHFLFGFPIVDEEDFRRNFILLLGKFHIYREKIYGKSHLDVLPVEKMAWKTHCKTNLKCGRYFMMNCKDQ